jgi:protein-disulfide isomerase
LAQNGRLSKALFDALSALAVTVLCVTLTWKLLTGAAPSAAVERSVAPLPVPTEPISLDGTAQNGHQSARAAVLVFTDFECPFCSRSRRAH